MAPDHKKSDISERDRKLIADLRKKLKEELTDDGYDTDYNLLRWFLAYNYVPRDVVGRLRRHLVMRRAVNLSEYHDLAGKTDFVQANYCPVSILGDCGRSNKLVVFEFPGRVDVPGLLKSVRTTPFMMGRFKSMEDLMRRLNEKEKATNQRSGAIFVYDLEGLQMDPGLLSIVTGCFRIMWTTIADLYPEWIHRFVVINAPTFVNVLWKALCPFLPEHTKVW